jgi:hypothetical protein
MQQYHAKLLLKRRDLLTDGRLLHPALAGGRRKGTRFGDAQKVAMALSLLFI